MTFKQFLALVFISLAPSAKADTLRILQGDILQLRSDNGNYVALKAPSSLAATYTFTMPADDGTSGQMLVGNGSGVFSWATPFDAASPGTIGGTTPGAGNFSSVNVNQSTGNTGGYFSTADNDTRITFPSDGLVNHYANGVLAMQMTPNGPYIKGVTYVWPGANAAGFLTNDGSGNLGWNAVDWTTPGTIGSATPNVGYFTNLNASKINLGQGDFSTTCVTFDSDTGLCSPGDGVLELWANNVPGMKLQSVGPVEIHGVPTVFPSSQGASGDVLTNDGSGNLGWAAPTAATPTGTMSYIAGFNESTGDLEAVPFLQFSASSGYGLRHNGSIDPFTYAGGYQHTFTNNYNPSDDTTGVQYGQLQLTTGLGTDDAGFDVDADGSGTFTQFDMYLDGQHNMSLGDVNHINLGGNFGNGTDAITGKRLRGISVFDNTNDNTSWENVDMYQHGINASATTTVGNYVGISDTSQFSGTLTNYSAVEVGNGTQAHVTNNVNGYSFLGNWQQVDGSVNIFRSSANGGDVTGGVYDFSAGGTWANVGGYTWGEDFTNITGVQSNSYFGLTFHPVIAESHGYFGVDIGPSIPLLTGGSAFMLNIHPTITTGAGEQVYGLNINMSNVTAATNQAIAIKVVGDSSFEGRMNTAQNTTLSSGAGFVIGNQDFQGIGIPDGVSLTGTMVLQHNNTTKIALGHGSSMDAGPFGIGDFANIYGFNPYGESDSGTADEVSLLTTLLNPDPASSGGTITNLSMFRTMEFPGGTFNITNLYGFRMSEPAGGLATNVYGVYIEPSAAINYLNGKTGIGTSSPSVPLDVNGAAKITDAGGNGGNVPHGYTRRIGTTATTSDTCSAACNTGEIAVGGGCENSLGVGLQNSVLSDDQTQSCTYLLATGDCTATVYCMQY